MNKLKLNSSLTDEEIQKNFESMDLYSGLKEGLEEALAYEKGSAKENTIIRKRNLPNINVSSLRKDLSLSQKAFAAVLGVSKRTVEAWESGKTTPSPTAKKLIYLISLDHTLVEKLKSSTS